MKITIIAVGSLKEKFWVDACALYSKRISSYSQIETIEISDTNPKKFDNDNQVLEDEGNRISKTLEKLNSPNCYVSSLCVEGNQFSSEKLAENIEEKKLIGYSHFIFIVGASCGLSESIKQTSNCKMSFGPITLPHNLARVVLLEQLYRACKINSGETYHK